MRIIQLQEKILNFDHNDIPARQKYASMVWQMLEDAYADIGGFQSASSVQELVQTPGLWKLVRRGATITAILIYKESHGRKLIAVATDQTAQGKQDLLRILREDQKLSRSWAEVSGKMESIYKKLGFLPLDNQLAGTLLNKKILDLDSDGIHYTRLIAGHPHVKAVYGIPRLAHVLAT